MKNNYKELYLFTLKREPTMLELATIRALRKLEKHEVDSAEYTKILDKVSTLHKMKEAEQSSRVSPDTIAIVTANLLGIIMIIRYEHANVITSRAMNMVQKLR